MKDRSFAVAVLEEAGEFLVPLQDLIKEAFQERIQRGAVQPPEGRET